MNWVSEQPQPAEDITTEVISGLSDSVALAEQHGVARERIAIDPGIGFGKTVAEPRVDREPGPTGGRISRISNSARLGKVCWKVMVRCSGRSALVRYADDGGAAVLKGAHIVRVHDVKAAVEAITVADSQVRANRQGKS